MLLAIRDRTRGWIAYLIVALLVVPFALFGLYNYIGNGGGEQTVAMVDGEEITRAALDQSYRSRQADLRRMLGDQFDPGLIDADQLRRQVLNELLERQLILNHARASGIQVSDADVSRFVRQQSFFQTDGAFSVDRYRQVLGQNNLTPERYEAQVRQDLATQLVRRAVESSAYTSDRELDRVLAIQQQEREIGWIAVPSAAFADDIALDDAAVEAWFADNGERFRQPARVQLAAIQLDAASLMEEVEVSDEAVRERYAARESEQTQTSERAVRHILVEVPSDAEDAAINAARQQISAARERIQSGESFAEVAADVSDDPGSAANGGDLGQVARGDLVPAFADAAWSLAPGELSEPVRTRFGWHLIEVTDSAEASLAPYEELAPALRREIARERAEQLVFERGNQLETLAFENPTTLEPAAQAIGVDVQRTDWIPRGGTDSGIGSEPAVLTAAFSDEQLARRENSDLLELGEDAYAVIRVTRHEPARVPELAEVRDEVTAAYRDARASELARDTASDMATALANGAALADAGASLPAARVEAPRLSGRNNRDLPGGVRERAFRLYLAEGAERVTGVARLPNGFAALQVTAVRDGDPDSVSAEQRQSLRAGINQVDGQTAFRSVIAALRADADIRIYEDRL